MSVSHCASGATTTPHTSSGSSTPTSCWRRFMIALQRQLAGRVRPLCQGVRRSMQDLLLQGRRVPVPWRRPRARPDPSGRTRGTRRTAERPGPDHRRPRASDPVRRRGRLDDLGSPGGRHRLPAALGRPGRHQNHHRHRRPRREAPIRCVHPEQVASYLAKYLTKATDDFGLPGQVRSAAHAAAGGATAHAVRIIDAAERLGRTTPGYERLFPPGHAGLPRAPDHQVPRLLGDLRADPPGPTPLPRQPGRPATRRRHPSAPRRRPIPDGFDLVSSWVFDGQGYLDLDPAAAVSSACRSRARRAAGRPHQSPPLEENQHEKANSRTGPMPDAALDREGDLGVPGCPTSTLYYWSHRGEGGPRILRIGRSCGTTRARRRVDELGRGVTWATSRSVRTALAGALPRPRLGASTPGTSGRRSTPSAGWCRREHQAPRRVGRPGPARITVGDWSTRWLQGQSQLKPLTRERYRNILRVQILPEWERVRLSRDHPRRRGRVGGEARRPTGTPPPLFARSTACSR